MLEVLYNSGCRWYGERKSPLFEERGVQLLVLGLGGVGSYRLEHHSNPFLDGLGWPVCVRGDWKSVLLQTFKITANGIRSHGAGFLQIITLRD
jgi:hypothetical protein